jgi:hypothetical protein
LFAVLESADFGIGQACLYLEVGHELAQAIALLDGRVEDRGKLLEESGLLLRGVSSIW